MISLLITALRHRRILCLIAVAMSCLQVAVIISSAMMFRNDMVYVDFRRNLRRQQFVAKRANSFLVRHKVRQVVAKVSWFGISARLAVLDVRVFVSKNFPTFLAFLMSFRECHRSSPSDVFK